MERYKLFDNDTRISGNDNVLLGGIVFGSTAFTSAEGLFVLAETGGISEQKLSS